MKNLPGCIAASLLLAASIPSRTQQTWTVKPEWVTAHEYFLASDALAGRGPASRDEELAATYVASEFESYGLKTAPGMNSYLQTADLIAPRLDGHATLKLGDTALQEGPDFFLFSSPGASVSGPLLRIVVADAQKSKIPPASAVLITGATDPKSLFAAITPLTPEQHRRSGFSRDSVTGRG